VPIKVGAVSMNGSYSGTLINNTNKILDTHDGKFILYDLTSDLIEGELYVKEGIVYDIVYADSNAEYL
jgi:hypothetical protein